MSKADELRLLREAIKSFPDALAIWSADDRLIACSDLYTRIAGAAGGRDSSEYQSVDGRWLRRTLRRLEGGARLELVTDVTELRRAEQAMRFLAYHDSLTGLPNRRLLDDRLRQAIRLAQRRDRMVATLLVHLDDFRQVNDALGHGAGDAVLREVAQRLAGCVRKADTLARAGADEFAVVVCDLKQPADCGIVAEKLLQALAAEFRVGSRRLRLAASIGISMFPSDGGDGEALLRNADAAMYRAKQLGRNQIRFFAR
ncbi:MAG: diguanylate cyclase domain-containing protein [Burkholderiales bacterium]